MQITHEFDSAPLCRRRREHRLAEALGYIDYDDKYTGLLGVAVGDALGRPYEASRHTWFDVPPDEGCSIGSRRGISAEMLGLREAMVFDWARRRKLPIAFVLAGGYTGTSLDRAQLVGLHRLTVSAAARVLHLDAMMR